MGIRIKPRITFKIRILSFFMAFVILVVSLPIWIGNTGTKVKAESLTGDGNHIYSDTKTTTIKTNGTNSSDTRFQYTGKITKAQTELFDYVSDYELINNSYNNIIHTEGGYDDAYKTLNTAISNIGYLETIDNTKISFRFKTAIRDVKDIKIYVFGNTGDTGWNNNPMIYDYSTGEYVKTFVASDLGFTPKKFIIHGDSDSYGKWQTYDLPDGSTLDAGKAYSINDCIESSGTANKISVKIPKTDTVIVKWGSDNSSGHILIEDDGYSIKAHIYDLSGHSQDVTLNDDSNGNWCADNIDVSSYSDTFYVSFNGYHWKKLSDNSTGWTNNVLLETIAWKVTKGKKLHFCKL